LEKKEYNKLLLFVRRNIMEYLSLIKLETKKYNIEDEIIIATIAKVKSYIKRYCNITEIPTDLDYLIVDMSVKILENKCKNDSESKEIKSKTMGDTSVTYNTQTNKEYTYDEITGQFSSDLNNYRCIRW
jgi:uncharacterized membrane protein